MDADAAALQVSGAVLDHATTGDGPPAILLHGLTGSRAQPQVVEELLVEQLLQTRRLTRYDARGHGRSTGRPQPEDYAWDHLAGDLLAVLDAVSPAEPVDAVGVSMGAATILHAAAREPQRFRRLVLALLPTAWEGRRAQRLAYRMNAAKIERRGVAAYAAGVHQAPVPPAQGAPHPVPDLVPELAAAVLRGAGLSDLPSPEELARITHPTLVLSWVDDATHPVVTAQRVADLLPASSAPEPAGSPAQVSAWGELVERHLGRQ